MKHASVAMLAVLCACDPGPPPATPGTLPPAAPEAGRRVPAGGTALRDAIAAAAPGEVLLLEPGRHEGPIRIERAVTVHGPRDAVVVSAGSGSTVEIAGAGARLLGLTVRGSGNRFDLLDSAVHVEADDVVVEGIAVREALFGILVEQSRRVTVRGCDVQGSGKAAMGLRGDGIRLWETSDSQVVDNVVRDCRDCVVWYSSRNSIVRNHVSGSRYGTHFMYSHDNVVEDNVYLGDVVGIFVMYSRDVTIRRNLMANASGAAGVGLGFKESGNVTVVANDFVANTTGIYIDTSPLDLAHVNRFERNLIRFSDTGISFHSSPRRNAFHGNDLRDNTHQVRVGGKGDALGADWQGNHFDDYQGYDLDGDGRGDVAYELRSLASQLTSHHPDLAFFRGTPVLLAAELVGDALPLFAPRTLVRDPSPRMEPMPRAGAAER